MKIDFRKQLLLGSAIVAVGAFGAAGVANADDLTLLGASVTGTDAPVDSYTAGDNIEMDGYDLTIDDAENTTIGAITDTNASPDGVLKIQTDTGGVIDQTIGSVSLGTGNFVIDNADGADGAAAVTVTVTGATTLASGDLDIDSSEATADNEATVVTFGGNTTIGGATTINTIGTGVVASTVLVNFDGASNTFTGGMTVTGGADADDTATVVVSGAAVDFGTGLILTDGAAGAAILTLDGGTTAQTVTGNIAGTGDINVANSAGVTFEGTVGAGTNVITIENGGAALNSAATFENTVNANNTGGITLGGAGTGTNTVTFDTTTNGSFTVTGDIDGAITGEVNNVVVTGANGTANVLTLGAGAGIGAGSNFIDNLTVSGNATLQLDTNNNVVDVTDGDGLVTVTKDATIDIGDGNFDATTVANAGSIIVNGTTTLTADITGAGTITASTTGGTIDGSVSNAITVEDNVDLTLANTADDEVISGAITLNDSGVDNGVIFDDGTGTLTVSGAIIAGTADQGLVQVADSTGTVAFTADIGAATKEVGAFDVDGGGSANTVTTTANIYAAAITVNAADTLQFSGSSTQNVSGTVTGGLLVFDSDSYVSFADDLNITDITNSGTIEIAAGKTITNAAAFDITDTGSYVLILSDVDGSNSFNDGDMAELSAPASAMDTDLFSVKVTGYLGDISGTDDILTGTTFDEAKALTDDSALYTVTAAMDGTITVAETATSSYTNSTSNANAATALLSAPAAVTGNLASARDNFAAAGSGSVNEVLESVAPTVDAGAFMAGTNVINQTAGVNNARLASLRDGSAATGMAAGNVAQGLKAWVQGYGTTATQDARDGVDGFDADTLGMAVGIDTETLADGWVWGLGFSYADTEVDSENANTTNTELDTYQVTLYADYDLDDRTYVSGQVGYAWGEADQTRHNVGGLSGVNAKSDYDTDQWLARLEAGRSYMMEGGMKLTPKALLNYAHYEADNYTETGAGTANLQVSQDDMDLFEIGVGADLAWNLQQADGSYLQPALEVGVRHDLIGDEFSTTGTFTGGGSSFKTEGFDPAQTTFNLGAGVTYFSTTNWELSAQYDFEYKSDYDAHSGLLKAAYKF